MQTEPVHWKSNLLISKAIKQIIALSVLTFILLVDYQQMQQVSNISSSFSVQFSYIELQCRLNIIYLCYNRSYMVSVRAQDVCTTRACVGVASQHVLARSEIAFSEIYCFCKSIVLKSIVYASRPPTPTIKIIKKHLALKEKGNICIFLFSDGQMH